MLTTHPMRMRILSERIELRILHPEWLYGTKDLSSHPTKVRFVHPGGTHESPVAGTVYPACPDSGRKAAPIRSSQRPGARRA